jgi:hypothetical protein
MPIFGNRDRKRFLECLDADRRNGVSISSGLHATRQGLRQAGERGVSDMNNFDSAQRRNQSSTLGPRDLTVLAFAFSDQEIRESKVNEIRCALQTGAYRIPAHIVAACVMLDMCELH